MSRKSTVTIQLDSELHFTSSTLTGRIIVDIASNIPATQSKIEVQLIGETKTYVKKCHTGLSSSGSRSASHVFLALTQVIADFSHPDSLILGATGILDLPFEFVIPRYLPNHICRHPVQQEGLRQLHLSAPPSLGRNSFYKQRANDMMPWKVSINYRIVARILDQKNLPTSCSTKKLQIFQSLDPQLPQLYDFPGQDRIPRVDKTLWKSIFSGPSGVLRMHSDKPTVFQLPWDYPQRLRPLNKSITIQVRFYPASSRNMPPILDTLRLKLKATTWYADRGRSVVPDMECFQSDPHQDVHHETISKSSWALKNVKWNSETDISTTLGVSQDDDRLWSPASNATRSGKRHECRRIVYFEAEIMVPITLPENRTFVPTFQSCLVSRTYSVDLDLKLERLSALNARAKIELPVYICPARID